MLALAVSLILVLTVLALIKWEDYRHHKPH